MSFAERPFLNLAAKQFTNAGRFVYTSAAFVISAIPCAATAFVGYSLGAVKMVEETTASIPYQHQAFSLILATGAGLIMRVAAASPRLEGSSKIRRELGVAALACCVALATGYALRVGDMSSPIEHTKAGALQKRIGEVVRSGKKGGAKEEFTGCEQGVCYSTTIPQIPASAFYASSIVHKAKF